MNPKPEIQYGHTACVSMIGSGWFRLWFDFFTSWLVAIKVEKNLSLPNKAFWRKVIFSFLFSLFPFLFSLSKIAGSLGPNSNLSLW